MLMLDAATGVADCHSMSPTEKRKEGWNEGREEGGIEGEAVFI